VGFFRVNLHRPAIMRVDDVSYDVGMALMSSCVMGAVGSSSSGGGCITSSVAVVLGSVRVSPRSGAYIRQLFGSS